jgi:hypothetical protein
VHWADETSLQLLAYLIRRGPQNVGFVMTLRPEVLGDARVLSQLLTALEREDRARQLAPGPLDRAAVGRLVQALRSGLSPERSTQLADRVWEVSAGHALMAVETARTLEPGTRARVPLPRRVEGLIASRLDALTTRAAEAAGTAAVIGRSFDFRLFVAATGLHDDAAAAVVEELVRRYVLHETDGQLDFRHARIRDVAYERLTGARRAALHRRIGEAIERVHGADLDDHALALAAHYRDAGAWERAARWFRRAGEMAFARFANRQSAAYFEGALEMMRRLAPGDDTRGEAIDLRFELHNVWSRLRDLEASHRVLAEASALARARGDRTRLRHALVHLCSLSVRQADYRGALDAAVEAQGIPGAGADVALRVRTSYDGGVASCAIGDIRRARELLAVNVRELAARRAERFGTVCSLFVSSCTWLSLAAADLGDFAAARAFGRRGVETADALGDHHGWVVAVCGRVGPRPRGGGRPGRRDRADGAGGPAVRLGGGDVAAALRAHRAGARVRARPPPGRCAPRARRRDRSRRPSDREPRVPGVESRSLSRRRRVAGAGRRRGPGARRTRAGARARAPASRGGHEALAAAGRHRGRPRARGPGLRDGALRGGGDAGGQARDAAGGRTRGPGPRPGPAGEAATGRRPRPRRGRRPRLSRDGHVRGPRGGADHAGRPHAPPSFPLRLPRAHCW